MTILEHFLMSSSDPEISPSLEEKLWEKVSIAYDNAGSKHASLHPLRWIVGLSLPLAVATIFIVHTTVQSPQNSNNAKLTQLDQEAQTLEIQMPQDMSQDPAFAEIVNTQ